VGTFISLDVAKLLTLRHSLVFGPLCAESDAKAMTKKRLSDNICLLYSVHAINASKVIASKTQSTCHYGTSSRNWCQDFTAQNGEWLGWGHQHRSE